MAPLGSKKAFLVKVIGIPRISDDVVDIKARDIAESLGLETERFHRGKRSVDLLIGIDHAHMHTGDKEDEMDS